MVKLNLVHFFLAIVCVFTLQIGYTVHLSVAGACFVVALIYGLRNLTLLSLGLALAGAVFLVVPIIFAPGGISFDMLVRAGREALCLFILVAFKNIKPRFDQAAHVRIRRALWIIILGLLLITALQAIDLYTARSGRFFLPYNLLPKPISLANCGTSADCWLKFGAEHGVLTLIRPAATYAEPSYLGFVILCLVFASQKVMSTNRAERTCFVVVGMVIALLAQTASGIAALIAVLLVTNWKALSRNVGIMLLGLAFLVGAAVLLGDRLEALMYGSDESGRIRLIYPFLAMGQMLEKGYIFGVPSESLSYVVRGDFAAAAGFTAGASDNALINMFLLYGVGGFAVLAILFARNSFAEIVLLVLSMQFNGAIFMYDKVILISLALLLYKGQFETRSASRPVSARTIAFPAEAADETLGRAAPQVVTASSVS
ncbi:hypothetical protein SAMN05444172_3825 [Burkholderia sp. GAS332]|nr:hypothetical protein SAMN05444172_3825 [Burkholderia sp. GAS332]